ncbi:hypothetical protein CKAH01_14888 [Colletotrichum kahawae]|uniref:Uncharacterized protein n=1 Tax=Colletotrichum kahawae TaxID=34407 RepID=A0AAD9YKQ5_COLKA|nr:hypothetical protein CKAH01_14888 [Colletotrichum kahawae]
MNIPDHVMFARHLAELAGESRDHGLRPFLEKKAAELIEELHCGCSNLADGWFDANISLVINLKQNPGKIFLGKNEAMEYFKVSYHKSDKEDRWHQLNFVLVTADRGRVTSYLEDFSVAFDENSPAGPTKKEVILITMDLNDSNKIQRMEYRLLCKDDDVDMDPHYDWDGGVDKIKNEPVNINYAI